jgi:hypothetical protein
MVTGDLGPVFFENAAAERIDLAKGDGFEATRAFEAEAEAADTGKKV